MSVTEQEINTKVTINYFSEQTVEISAKIGILKKNWKESSLEGI